MSAVSQSNKGFEGILNHEGERYFCVLMDECFSLTPLGEDDSHKGASRYLKFEEIIGVRGDSVDFVKFAVYIFTSFNTFLTPSERLNAIDEMIFTSENETTCREWVNCFQSLLKGIPYEKDQVVLPRRMKVIVNPRSKYDGIAVLELMDTLLSCGNVVFEVTRTLMPGHATAIARDFSPVINTVNSQLSDQLRYDALVVVGGDKTVEETINGLLNRSDWKEVLMTPIAIIPTGNSNVIATSLEITDIFRAAQKIIKIGKKRVSDVMSVIQGQHQRFAVGSLTWGVFQQTDADYEILGALAFSFQKILMKDPEYFTGEIWYLPANTPNPSSDSPLDLKYINVPENKWIKISGEFNSVIISNVPVKIFGFELTKEAKHEDGLVHLSIIKKTSRLGLASSLWSIRSSGQANQAGSEYYQAKAVRVFPRYSNRRLPEYLKTFVPNQASTNSKSKVKERAEEEEEEEEDGEEDMTFMQPSFTLDFARSDAPIHVENHSKVVYFLS